MKIDIRVMIITTLIITYPGVGFISYYHEFLSTPQNFSTAKKSAPAKNLTQLVSDTPKNPPVPEFYCVDKAVSLCILIQPKKKRTCKAGLDSSNCQIFIDMAEKVLIQLEQKRLFFQTI